MGDDLTVDYIAEHKQTIHTPDSWGRAILEKALTEAASEIQASGPSDNVKVKTELTITATTKGCVQVCGWGVCIHVDV